MTETALREAILDEFQKLLVTNLPVKLDVNTDPVTYLAGSLSDCQDEENCHTLDNYRKSISSTTGVSTVGQLATNQDALLFQNDFQNSIQLFNQTIDQLVQCKYNPENKTYDSYTGDSILYYDQGNAECADAGLLSDCFSFINYADYSGTPGGCGVPTLSIVHIIEYISQFFTFNTTQQTIDPLLAQQYLDTNIFELYPGGLTRQQRIDRLFSEFTALAGQPPSADIAGAFDLDVGDGGELDTWADLTAGQTNWSNTYGITNNPNTGNIERLTTHGGVKSLETLRETIDTYLTDIDKELITDTVDDRPIYENKSAGYLKLRHLNQGIIVRREEGDDVGLIGEEEAGYGIDNPKWLTTGFTVTMWVKFLDKVNSGTLFNFGNPLRDNNPMGFMLETFIADKNDYNPADIPQTAFLNHDQERFVRLVVSEPESVRDSHVGTLTLPRIQTTSLPALEQNLNYTFNYTQIPIDLNQWYFIVATYDPNIMEDTSFDVNGDLCPNINCNYQPEFWNWNIEPNGSVYTDFSNYGAKCKVEIISKSDLIRARGFREE